MTDIQSQFPGLRSEVAYLDNAATTQICEASIDAMTAYLRAGRANVGRGLYPMAEASMVAYEDARKTIANFIDADPATTVFTKSVTEGLNAIAFGVRSMLNAGDEILVSPFEHHANLLPWRRIARERGAIVRTMPMTEDFMLDVDGAVAMMNEKTKIIATTMVSNVLGTIVPVAKLAIRAREIGALVIVDAAQAVAHLPISMRDLGADAIVFGSHKCYGPAGIAAMALSQRLASIMEPMIVGGGMVDAVLADAETWREIPARFEGGSPNVEGAVGFAATLTAIPLLTKEGLGEVALRDRLIAGLRSIPGITIFNPREAVGIVSFVIDGIHPHDVADLLGQRGVCIRAGHHCAQPLSDRIVPNGGTIRVSLAIYSTQEEVDRFLAALRDVLAILK
jgi:cysteine desulfurase / selenocysteine lyase